jgi:hypothetical protein
MGRSCTRQSPRARGGRAMFSTETRSARAILPLFDSCADTRRVVAGSPAAACGRRSSPRLNVGVCPLETALPGRCLQNHQRRAERWTRECMSNSSDATVRFIRSRRRIVASTTERRLIQAVLQPAPPPSSDAARQRPATAPRLQAGIKRHQSETHRAPRVAKVRDFATSRGIAGRAPSAPATDASVRPEVDTATPEQ